MGGRLERRYGSRVKFDRACSRNAERGIDDVDATACLRLGRGATLGRYSRMAAGDGQSEQHRRPAATEFGPGDSTEKFLADRAREAGGMAPPIRPAETIRRGHSTAGRYQEHLLST